MLSSQGVRLKEMAEYAFPVTLGRDFAGVLEQAGAGVGRYRVGDEVFGFLPAVNRIVHAGSWAELIVLPEDDFVAAAPHGVDLALAGAAPVGPSPRSPPSTRSRSPRARASSSSGPPAASAASSSSWPLPQERR
jgi:hypothetical protein